MRILLINDFLVGGGAEKVLNHLEATLRELGHQVDIMIGHENIQKAKDPFSYIYNHNSRKKLNRILRDKNYQFIFVFNYASYLSPSILYELNKYKKRFCTKIIYYAHDAHLICPNSGLMFFTKDNYYTFEKYPRIKDWFLKNLDHRSPLHSWLKKSQWLINYKLFKAHNVFDKVIVPGNYIGDFIKQIFSPDKVNIIRNPCIKRSSIFADYNKTVEHEIRMVFAGRLSQEKGLLQFLKLLVETNEDYIFDIYGSGPQEEVLRTFVKRHQLNKVNFKGFIEHRELEERLTYYNALVLPSTVPENAPLSIIEAAAKGLFIITNNKGGMKELSDIVGNRFYIDAKKNNINEILDLIRVSKFHAHDLSDFTFEAYTQHISGELN